MPNPNLKAGPGRPKGSKNRAPAGLGAYVRDQTRDGQEIVDLFVKVLRGQAPDEASKLPTIQDRMEAGEWLADRGFGRVQPAVEGDLDEQRNVWINILMGLPPRQLTDINARYLEAGPNGNGNGHGGDTH